MIEPRSAQELMAQADNLIRIFHDFARRNDLAGMAAADHIGFRCDSHELFKSLRALFEGDESEYVYQSIISKRPIAIIKLRVPLATELGPISFLELADQKPDGSQKRGFDHVEIFPVRITYEEFRSRLEASGEKFQEKARPHHTTHDIQLPGCTVRLEKEPLIEKIKRSEMVN